MVHSCLPKGGTDCFKIPKRSPGHCTSFSVLKESRYNTSFTLEGMSWIAQHRRAQKVYQCGRPVNFCGIYFPPSGMHACILSQCLDQLLPLVHQVLSAWNYWSSRPAWCPYRIERQLRSLWIRLLLRAGELVGKHSEMYSWPYSWMLTVYDDLILRSVTANLVPGVCGLSLGTKSYLKQQQQWYSQPE